MAVIARCRVGQAKRRKRRPVVVETPEQLGGEVAGVHRGATVAEEQDLVSLTERPNHLVRQSDGLRDAVAAQQCVSVCGSLLEVRADHGRGVG